ncbi:Subtilisin-like serine endopeptidase family protein [Zea mays]|uniref:Subtilisin-like serine endopeptidase family protein n=1 Tax=Zea mays TaxID=4577 RepID=A0A1D6F706_MAIZE|nr:Subtilisin-like serine endopeptidase family protein [Zea mays]
MGWRPHVVSVSSSALLVLLQLLVLLMLPADASSSSQTTTTIYVVYMGEKKHDDPSLVVASHHATLASVLGSKDEALSSIVYSYKHGFSGFAAKLTQPQAEELKKYPGVVSVKPNTYHHVHTTRSWDFLGMSYGQQQSSSWSSSSRLLRKAKYGEDVIVGVIDSGIWPESRSFDDSGYGYGPVPKRWKGVCQTGQAFNASNCNRKVIGARWYAADVSEEDLKNEYRSPRDANGHGTHTASTIAGSPVRNASHHGGGLAAGIARGGAPRARLAIYKACHAVGGSASCGDASILAALDAAIGDGVDLVSLSLGGLGEIYQSLHAVAAGITVVLAAGNDGPVEQSLNNALPWGITVAAATMDRTFPTVVTLGDGEKLVGQSLYYHNRSAAASTSDDDDFAWRHLILFPSCDEKNLGSENITGKIVICRAPVFWSDYPPPRQLSRASRAAIAGGAKGIIFEQYSTNSLDTQVVCQGHLPCVVVDRESIFTIQSSDSNVAKISPAATMVGSQVASPRIATFSSRGPSAEFPSVLKPDIAAPGVSILAAMRDSYVLLSGTSMACPHVSAVVALLKSVHPDWSPAMIKSAIVTTASVTDRFGLPIQANSVQRKPADAFDMGGGLIAPDRAMDPGLVYDIQPEEYTRLDDRADRLNLPSIAVSDLKNSVTVSRTVTNVGPAEVATYRAVVEAPAGVTMDVEPPVIAFERGGARNATFRVTFVAKQRVQGGYAFGSLTWLDDAKRHSVRIPVAVRTVVRDLVADVA